MPRVSSEVGDWERYLCAPVTGRKVICAFEVLAAMTTLVAKFQRWGAERPLLIADGVGTGPLPLETDADIMVIAAPDVGSLTDQVRARMHVSDRLTPELVEMVDRYDPEGEAVWWVGPPSPNRPVLGRGVLGGRPPHQAALEDKTIVDDLLAAVGAPSTGSLVAAADDDSLAAAGARVRALSGSDDLVLAGDARDGINGGGDYVRWIHTPGHARDAAAFFAAHCDRVRVSPYLEGVPCSIHGIVLPDGVVVLRPVELATLLDRDAGRFFYGGMGTGWDPPPAGRREMRELAGRLGGHLRDVYDFVGGFGVDGVLTAAGFRVTELNPRFSGGLSRLAAGAPEAQLELVQVNAVLGRDIGRPAAEIEELALEALDEFRFVEAMGMSRAQRPTDSTQISVSTDGTRLAPADDDSDAAIGTVVFGPSPVGAFVRLRLHPEAAEAGMRTAVLAIHLLSLADEVWHTEFGALAVPAPAAGHTG